MRANIYEYYLSILNHEVYDDSVFNINRDRVKLTEFALQFVKP